MNALKTTNSRLLIGAILLASGFYTLTNFSWAWWTLLACGVLAWLIAFGKDTRKVFGLPGRLWLIPLGVLAYLALGVAISMIADALGFNWVGNPAAGHFMQIIWRLPFMLLGEELLGIGILEGARSKGMSMRWSMLLSALLFGLIHTFTYWDGSMISTLLHILLLQGVARLIFNFIYLKCGRSIWSSWLTHMLVDIIALSV